MWRTLAHDRYSSNAVSAAANAHVRNVDGAAALVQKLPGAAPGMG